MQRPLHVFTKPATLSMTRQSVCVGLTHYIFLLGLLFFSVSLASSDPCSENNYSLTILPYPYWALVVYYVLGPNTTPISGCHWLFVFCIIPVNIQCIDERLDPTKIHTCLRTKPPIRLCIMDVHLTVSSIHVRTGSLGATTLTTSDLTFATTVSLTTNIANLETSLSSTDRIAITLPVEKQWAFDDNGGAGGVSVCTVSHNGGPDIAGTHTASG